MDRFDLEPRDVARLAALRAGAAATAASARMDKVFAIFPRLRERRAQLAATQSGGERQTLAISRALMLDEPSLGLAPLIVREVLQTVARLRETGVSVQLIEQNARAALRIADRGHVLEMGPSPCTGQPKPCCTTAASSTPTWA